MERKLITYLRSYPPTDHYWKVKCRLSERPPRSRIYTDLLHVAILAVSGFLGVLCDTDLTWTTSRP